MGVSYCPSCRQYEVIILTTPCGRRAYYCRNCDYGINECTEGECDHKIS
jgi:hypothetical protein